MTVSPSPNADAATAKEPLPLSEVRRSAWETRRAKYGKAGHAGAYARTPHNVEAAREEISVARRHLQLLLPDEAAHRAITALDRADVHLGGPPQWPDFLAPAHAVPVRKRAGKSPQ
jgi:hypothetical protein